VSAAGNAVSPWEVDFLQPQKGSRGRKAVNPDSEVEPRISRIFTDALATAGAPWSANLVPEFFVKIRENPFDPWSNLHASCRSTSDF
jgi:hypothetical protein